MDTKQKRQLFDQLDCACSALLINCGQFGCCIADVPDHEFGFGNSDWMTQLSKVADDELKLRDLAVPGTHDSGTSTIGKSQPFSAVGRTQNCDVYEQLQRGARYLDIRAAGKGGDKEAVYIFHGALSGAKLKDVLEQIVKFMEENPGEFLFLEIVQEYGRDFSPEQRVYMLDMLKETLGTKASADNDFAKLVDGTPLKEIAESEASCVVMVHPRLVPFDYDGTTYTDEVILEKYCFFNSKKVMMSKWHNTRDIDMLLQWNKEELQKNGTNHSKLLVNQLLLTPGVGGASDVARLLSGQLSLRPVSFATSLYKRDVLDNYLRENAEEPWNLLSLDFIDLAPAMISFMISLNFPSILTVLTAAANPGGDQESIDVTEKVQSFIKRGKVLYITNVQQDLGLDFGDGTLTIAYSIGESSQQSVLDVDFDEATEIVLGEYSHNEGNIVHVDTEQQSSGVVLGGKILSEDEYHSSGQGGAAIGYSKDADETKFKILR